MVFPFIDGQFSSSLTPNLFCLFGSDEFDICLKMLMQVGSSMLLQFTKHYCGESTGSTKDDAKLSKVVLAKQKLQIFLLMLQWP